jgi:hypothetical protein
MAIIRLKDFIKLIDDPVNDVIDVYDTTESDFHRTLYEGYANGFDFETTVRGNVANEEVVVIYPYELGICIGIGNPSGL